MDMADKPTYLEYIQQHEEKRRKYAQAHGLDYESLYPTHKKAAPPEAEEEPASEEYPAEETAPQEDEYGATVADEVEAPASDEEPDAEEAAEPE